MAVEFTTAAIVLTYLKGAGTSIATADIEEIIEQCEAFWKVTLKIPTGFTFAAGTKVHKMLRLAVTCQAARIVIASTPQSFNTLDQAGIALDLLTEQYEDCKKYLIENRSSFEFINENPSA